MVTTGAATGASYCTLAPGAEAHAGIAFATPDFGYNKRQEPGGKKARSPIIENDAIVDQNCDLGRFKL
jgi:hypothetical protein